MACTPQELITANGCFNCALTSQMASAIELTMICIKAGGIAPPPADIVVIGGEGGDVIIIGGEGGGDLGPEGT